MKKNARNNVSLALLIVGLILIIFGSLFGAAIATLESSRATRAEKLDPATIVQIAQRAPGREVLAQGVIDPRAKQLRGQLVAYVVERRETDSDGDERWQVVERVTPALLLALPDGVAQVVAGDYELDQPPLVVEEGDLRYRGFVHGAVVTAIGTIVAGSEGNAIDADLLFGGSREEYIRARRVGATTFGWVGLGFAVLGACLLLIAGWRILNV